MAAVTNTLNSQLKKRVKFEFTADHTQITLTLLAQLARPKVLALPYFAIGISGARPFQLFTDASADGLRAVIEQEQRDGTTRPLSVFSPIALLLKCSPQSHINS